MNAAATLRTWLRTALAATSACLGMGLLMSFLVTGPAAEVAVALVWTGIGLLLLVPVGNVIAVLIDEWRQPSRTFAWAALAVLALLAGTIASRF
ncbi:MAG: hypothetical protein AMXMBFR57_11090 [Acidimicrobiia bacterium]